MAYFDLAKQKGFVGQGNPILYVAANDTRELTKERKEGVIVTHNLVAEWPAIHGHLQKRTDNRGLVSLCLYYFTKPVEYKDFEAFKDGCRIRDMTLNNAYNSLDLFEVIKNADWNVRVNLFVKRMSHDSTLPIGFFEAINNGHALFKDGVPDPQRRTPLCEEASIEYSFDSNLVLVGSQASGNLYPSGMYGGLICPSSPNYFDESKAPRRPPRAWAVLTEDDALRAESGIEGYNEIVKSYLKQGIPMQANLQGKSLEIMVKEVMPQVIDSLIDFVEN